MSNPKRQHYVPQTYLNHFSDESGYLHIYDKVKDEFRKQAPVNAGYSKHFYTIDYNGEKDFFIENALAQRIDILYNPIVEKVTKNEILNNKDKQNLGLYLACQHLRTPAHRKNYNQMFETGVKQLTKLKYSFQKHHEILTDEMKHPELESIIENEEYTVDVPKEYSLELLMSFADEMGNMLSRHNIIVIKASSKAEFISSDNPYNMYKEDWVQPWEGLGVINTVKIFPLTPKYILILKGVGENMIYTPPLARDKVRDFNFQVASSSDRYLFSGNEPLLRDLVRRIKKKLMKS